MSLMNSMNVSASGLTAQTLRMDTISENIANVNTTRTEDGTPYKRKSVLFQEKNEAHPFSQIFDKMVGASTNGKGVMVTNIIEDPTEGNLVYDPQNPDANENGYVEMPNVNIVTEMVNMISASRSYEANVTALNTTKSMITKTLEISR